MSGVVEFPFVPSGSRAWGARAIDVRIGYKR